MPDIWSELKRDSIRDLYRALTDKLYWLENDNSRHGQKAETETIFGPNGRYSIAPIHTRFGKLEWFVWDHLTECPETGLATIVVQSGTIVGALYGNDTKRPWN